MISSNGCHSFNTSYSVPKANNITLYQSSTPSNQCPLNISSPAVTPGDGRPVGSLSFSAVVTGRVPSLNDGSTSSSTAFGYDVLSKSVLTTDQRKSKYIIYSYFDHFLFFFSNQYLLKL